MINLCGVFEEFTERSLESNLTCPERSRGRLEYKRELCQLEVKGGEKKRKKL